MFTTQQQKIYSIKGLEPHSWGQDNSEELKPLRRQLAVIYGVIHLWPWSCLPPTSQQGRFHSCQVYKTHSGTAVHTAQTGDEPHAKIEFRELYIRNGWIEFRLKFHQKVINCAQAFLVTSLSVKFWLSCSQVRWKLTWCKNIRSHIRTYLREKNKWLVC